jgi:hypothetical protein
MIQWMRPRGEQLEALEQILQAQQGPYPLIERVLVLDHRRGGPGCPGPRRAGWPEGGFEAHRLILNQRVAEDKRIRSGYGRPQRQRL